MDSNSLRFDIQTLLTRGDWQPFRPGIEVIRLHGDVGKAGSAALLRYHPGATLPTHSHTGFEHIFTLEGEQQDERGTYRTGTFVVNLPNSMHTVQSQAGCTVLVVWSADVSFS